jgi:MFS family permease
MVYRVNEPSSKTVPRRLGPRVAFTAAAGVIGLCLAAATVPSPLYKLYQATWQFSTPTLTLVYAVYCFGVLAALLSFGRISDVWGRRPVITLGLAALLAAMGLFVVASSVAGLFAARSLQGLATGFAISAAGAALLELHPGGAPGRAGLMNAVASSLGVGCGGLLGAVLVQYAPSPFVTPFALLACLVVGLIIAVRYLPETVAKQARTGFRLARPRVPREIVAPFTLAGLGITTAWANVGMYQALVPALAPALLDSTGYLPAGLAIFALGAASAIAPLLGQRLSPHALIATGMVTLITGVGLMSLALSPSNAPLFIGASLVIGTGVGLGMVGSLRLLGSVAPSAHRASVMAAFYIVAYLAISIPAVAAGFVVPDLGPVQTFHIFTIGVVMLSLTALMLATTQRRTTHLERATRSTRIKSKVAD